MEEKIEEKIEREELNLDAKVTVKSIAGWTTGFTRRADGIGDVSIPPNGSTRLSRNEVITQVQNGNKLFAGVDGRGSHATLVVEDAPTRVELDFESEDGKRTQQVFSDDLLKKLFELKSQKTFETRFAEAIVTRAEKYAAINAIKRLGFNDYKKIRFIEQYTGFNME